MDSKIHPLSPSSASQKSQEPLSPTPILQRTTFARLRNKITEIEENNEPEDKSKNVMEMIRLQFKDFIYHTVFGRIYAQLMLFISILSSFEYIYQTYLNVAIDDSSGAQADFLSKFEIFIALACGFDWFINFFIADHRGLFVTRYYLIILSSLSTFFSTVPVYVFTFDIDIASSLSLIYLPCFLSYPPIKKLVLRCV